VEPALKGRLLVATPALVDPNFFRTVVLVIEHTEEGAAGVVLNRPSEMELGASPLAAWEDVAADPPRVFVGGPVSPTDALCIAHKRSTADLAGWQPVTAEIGMLDLASDEVRTEVDGLRVFAGYAGWGPGQLEGEIEEGSWYVLEADRGDVLSSDPSTLWRDVLQRQGGKLALVSSFPVDPSMN
jgi:putative transcriptional regulator